MGSAICNFYPKNEEGERDMENFKNNSKEFQFQNEESKNYQIPYQVKLINQNLSYIQQDNSNHGIYRQNYIPSNVPPDKFISLNNPQNESFKPNNQQNQFITPNNPQNQSFTFSNNISPLNNKNNIVNNRYLNSNNNQEISYYCPNGIGIEVNREGNFKNTLEKKVFNFYNIHKQDDNKFNNLRNVKRNGNNNNYLNNLNQPNTLQCFPYIEVGRKKKRKLTLQPLSSISQTQLITRFHIKKEISIYNLKGEISAIDHIIKNGNKDNEFIHIPYEIIPETIMNIMFQQGNKGICYLVAGINAFNEIPSIFDQLFIDKYYSENKKEYKLQAFINSKMEVISLDDKFLYEIKGNNKIMYEGNQTYQYELFLKFIVKLFVELNKSEEDFDYNEIRYSYNKLKRINKGGRASELYSCILGTSSLLDNSDNIEKYINNPRNIIATYTYFHQYTYGHQYAVKSMFEYFGKNGKKQKFITLFNPWGYGNPDEEKFFEEVKDESKNYEFVYEFNNNYKNSGLIKIPLNLFKKKFPGIEVCTPRYGYHYKVLRNKIEINSYHYYCFYNDIKQNIEIELFLGELNNVRRIKVNTTNIKISLYKIEKDLNFTLKDRRSQNDSFFFVRKNAYIFKELEEGNYLIFIEGNEFKEKWHEYNLRIGGEIDFVKKVSNDIIENLKYKYNYNQYNNIYEDLIISKYILLEKTYYDMKIYSIAQKIYNIFYNPYEYNIDIEIKNGVKEIISLIKDAYNNKIYEIKKNYSTNKNLINYLFNNIKNNINLQPMTGVSKTINNYELEILKIYQSLNEYAENVDVFLLLPDNSSKKMTLKKLKNIITGPKKEKEYFYEKVRGYHIPLYGIDININKDELKKKNELKNKNVRNKELKKKKILEEMERAINYERNLVSRNCSFCESTYEINYDYIDILFMVDATESMTPYINASIKNCKNIVQTIELKFPYKIKKFGAIFYRDPIDRKEDKHTYIQLTSNGNSFQNQIEGIKAFGGNDYAEDWNGAYEIALNKINWTNERGNKIVIHIADASAHGNEFIEPGIEDKHPHEGPKFIETIKKVAKKGIKII